MIFEGDAQLVVNFVNSVDENRLWYGQFVDDIRLMLKRRTDWKVVFTPTTSNYVAHQLANLSFYVRMML